MTSLKDEPGTSSSPRARDDDGRRRAVVRTTLIVVVVLGAAFAFALAMTRRLISSWNP